MVNARIIAEEISTGKSSTCFDAADKPATMMAATTSRGAGGAGGARRAWLQQHLRTGSGRTAHLNPSDDSAAELERPAARRLSRPPRRRRVDTLVSQDGDRRRVAGRRLPGLLNGYSNEPGPARPYLEFGHDGEMQLDGSDKHPQTAPARVIYVTRVTIRPVSRDISVLIVLGRSDMVPIKYDNGVASAIADAVGHVVKLASISIDLLPPGAWLLTGIVRGPEKDGDIRTGDGQLIA